MSLEATCPDQPTPLRRRGVRPNADRLTTRWSPNTSGLATRQNMARWVAPHRSEGLIRKRARWSKSSILELEQCCQSETNAQLDAQRADPEAYRSPLLIGAR